MEEDVKEVEETSSEESTEETSEEESKETDESKDVPYSRFKKVIEERNKLKEERDSLKVKEEAVKQTLNPTEPQPEKKEESLSRAEAVLYAQGFTEDEVTRIKKVADIDEVGLVDASKSDMFVAWKEKRDANEANKKAQLGASSGSAPFAEQTFSQDNMSDEDHRALFREKFNQ